MREAITEMAKRRHATYREEADNGEARKRTFCSGALKSSSLSE